MNRHTTRIAGTVAGLALAAIVALPALAAPGSRAGSGPAGLDVPNADSSAARCLVARQGVRSDRSVANLQAFGFCEIDRRLDTITRLQALVHEANVLTPDHATALNQILTSSETGLKALRVQIAGDTTVAATAKDVRRIFSEYRIYALVTRQVALVRADDRVDAAAARLTTVAGKLNTAIEKAASKGKDVTAAETHLAALNAAIAAARAEVAGDATAVLAQTPASWNTGTAKPILDAAHASVVAARHDLRTAVAEARATRTALR